MKKIIAFTGLFILVSAVWMQLMAQTTTFILLRHAEKDTTQSGSTMMKADPPLTKAGELRAEHLLDVIKEYTPDIIYSTNYTRTKATVTPLAKKFSKEIQVYDPKNLAAFSEQIMQHTGKTIVVAGHSNTTPSLVNLLIKESKYPSLDESIYNQFWIVTIDNGKTTTKLVTY
jgi:2,3-bisphosphoglycerate-dependent phosphoglycerate mutase